MTTVSFFEDLFVGQRFRSPAVEVVEEDVLRFACENDPQSFHVNAEAAAESLFGGLVASGWHTASLSMRLLLEASWPRLAGGAIGADAKISWKLPVRPGDWLRADAEVIGRAPSRSRDDIGVVNFRMTTFNQRNEPVMVLESTAFVRRKPARQQRDTQK